VKNEEIKEKENYQDIQFSSSLLCFFPNLSLEWQSGSSVVQKCQSLPSWLYLHQQGLWYCCLLSNISHFRGKLVSIRSNRNGKSLLPQLHTHTRVGRTGRWTEKRLQEC